jgi:sec-independent protein translocase protein TatA
MGELSPAHLIIILVVVLIVMGPRKLPETGAALGRAIRDFRHAVAGTDELLQGPGTTAATHASPNAEATDGSVGPGGAPRV